MEPSAAMAAVASSVGLSLGLCAPSQRSGCCGEVQLLGAVAPLHQVRPGVRLVNSSSAKNNT